MEGLNKKYRTLGFGEKVSAYFKDTSGGVYDIYIKGICLVYGISQTELEILVKILKLEEL